MSASTDGLFATHRTVRELLASAEAVLAAADVASPRHDAETLLAHAIDVERSGLARLQVMGARLDVEQADRFRSLVEARSRREPLQHLTGRAPFRHIELLVGPGVFVPRPETELVAGRAIETLSAGLGDESARLHAPLVVDLCSGSGAIALSIAHEVPSARVSAVELGDDAVLWLRRNVEELGLGDRVSVWHGDAGDAAALLPEMIGRCDVVVSNPPYVPDGAVIRDPEVVVHDPSLALWGGPDGLDVVRRIESQAALLLRPGGVLIIEHADLQGESLPSLLAAAHDGQARPNWIDIVDHPDLAGRPRFATARRAGSS